MEEVCACALLPMMPSAVYISGRLWVLENTNYPDSPGKPKDRILVLEDADGDE